MPQPNILFLFSDEHSFRFMSHRPVDEGGEPCRTPNFDRLASQGTVFTDAYCQMPLCTPSRMCLLSGREVRGCGAWSNSSVLRPEIPTIPGTLAEAGYSTCLVGKMHFGGNLQFAGFQHRPYGDLTGGTGHQWEPLERGGDGMRLRTECAGITEIPESKIQDVVVAQESLAFIREHQHSNPDQPWFLCASFSRPHFPLTAPKRFFERYWPDGVTPPKVAATGDAYDHPMSVGMRKGFKTEEIPEEEMMRARAAYFACVDYFDEVVGDLLMRLEADRLLDNTIIVYTSDHGEMAGEHGTWWKNGWYEACTHVPLIISTPGQRRGETPAGRCAVPVSLADLFPTFCGFADVERPGGLDGEDLSAVVNGDAEAPDRPVFTDALTPRWGEGTEFRSIRWRHYKYVTFHGHPPLFFDLEADPAEQTNLVETAEGKAAEALATLKRIASESIDFEEAERERIERDGALAQQHKLEVPKTAGSNMYLMPSGKVVAADDTIYAPQVVTDNPADVFGDWPG